MLAEIGDSTELRDWVACAVRPITEHLDALGHPSWYARFIAQVTADPALQASQGIPRRRPVDAAAAGRPEPVPARPVLILAGHPQAGLIAIGRRAHRDAVEPRSPARPGRGHRSAARRRSGSRAAGCGTAGTVLDMDSVPPATMTSDWPAMIC